VKKKPNFIPFILAALLFFVAVAALYHWQSVKNQEAQAAIDAQKAADAAALAAAQEKQISVPQTPTNMRTVLYATQPVEPGNRISPAFYEKKLTPSDILPDAYTDKDEEAVAGSFAIRHIEKGDPLTPRNVGKSLPYLSQRIPPGMRAIALPIFNADVNDTGGFVVDGDKVDLLYTVINGDSQLINTQTVLQNINVLYVPGPPTKTDETDGLTPVPAPGGAISITFEVTPEEAQELVFLSGAKDGKFSMILRSRKDEAEIRVKPFNSADYDPTNLSKVQRTADKSVERVKALAAEIAAKEKEAQGNTNETNTPPATP
jgi:Flp pilus assembly protein CpaB